MKREVYTVAYSVNYASLRAKFMYTVYTPIRITYLVFIHE